MSAPMPGIHQIVLVINGQSQRLSKPLQEVIRVLREVFDADGKQGFVEHLSVMFTKIEFSDWSQEETTERFQELFEEKKRQLADSWASVTTGLGQKGVLDLTQAEADDLKRRFLFVNNTLPPRMLHCLEEEFDLKPELGLGDVYLRAMRHLRTPFSLSAINSNALTNEQKQLAMMRRILANQQAQQVQLQATEAQLQANE